MLSTLPPPRYDAIYCNRSLRLDRIQVVGFDMDYTLATYHQRAVDQLSITLTVGNLIERGYPKRLEQLSYPLEFPIRGLLIDKKLGHVLKMDRHRYVKKAFHGLDEIARNHRQRLYHTKQLRPGMERYRWVDTLYSLSEVSMFAAITSELERQGGSVNYDKVFEDIRDCNNLAHHNGTFHQAVLDNLPQYVNRDPKLGETLDTLRRAGKRIFLLTNSPAEYTHRMMHYLLDEGSDDNDAANSWYSRFDVIVMAACKPAFFNERASLKPTDMPMPKSLDPSPECFLGGNIRSLEHVLGCRGDRVLYVGDHIYGDVLRAKKDSAWRTLMIIQEMQEELEAVERTRAQMPRLDQLHQERDRVRRRIRHARYRDSPLADPELKEMHQAMEKLDRDYEALEKEVAEHFHPCWGSLFKAGNELSHFGHQVESYACLYTSRVSNLLFYAANHAFRSPRDLMPHESA